MSIKIIDNKLVFEEAVNPPLQMPEQKTNLLRESSVTEFTALLASKLPAPGGGGVAALAAAQGFALASMVCNLTFGKKKFAEHESRLHEIQEHSSKLASRMLELVDLDEEYFLPLSKAYGLPSNTEEEKAQNEMILNDALATACLVPLETLKTSYEAYEMLIELMRKSSKMVVSDIGVAAECFRAAIESAKLNLLINIRLMKDSPMKEELKNHLNAVLEQYHKYHAEVMDFVMTALVFEE